METYDFAVIGTGSGLDVANVAAKRGQSVAIVEKGPIGGTCLNRGCIPSKLLLYHADVVETIERADEFHIDASVESVDFAEIVREVNEEVSGDADSIRRGLQSSPRHDLYEGEGRFVDERTIAIHGGDDDGSRFRAETVLVAAGTRPAIPDIDGIQGVDHLTSTEALQLESPPDHLLVVGGGYIAAELGHFFGTFGSDVTIVGRRPTLLPEADDEVAATFTERFEDRFTVHTGHAATSVSSDGDEIALEARPYEYGDDAGLVDGGEPVTVSGDALLVAAGRIPNTDTLNLDATGVETDDRGFVRTDEYLRTTADGVWALGDIVGEHLLKHSANHEARTVVRNVFGDELEPVDYSAMPFAVFTSPEVAGVGARESDLRAAGREYATNTYPYEQTARGSAMKAEGFVKAIVDLEGTILGCHIVGPEAATLVQAVVVAMKSGSGSVQNLRDAVHIHPALPEVVQRAFSGQFTRGGVHQAGQGAPHDH
ncbi:Pyruvate/2-oxoglutarate dehydrogenase complex, dihydrolipoamide dehydrogenase (E3) component or related enzyme [Halanaeroarchaeum sp. HSR-CO]|uniref:dihydrolipoyl dehydrogenase n=1 Tax=Halanaeroarchaeum sp. HSR-CO TaxID=2866382 RepID=UPI00217D1965|nr:dihydrolipoyl dehydrogenase [Halanaeroarchaeum sp. HSR-CO]UWG48851.1 Pyruvate/2-oxoglutarate dehydrogenase complex, dihydrolipoamide dehydrogenase (E3) component or related enzyme [Halanaeroarchaeum sp. HSR-CO]